MIGSLLFGSIAACAIIARSIPEKIIRDNERKGFIKEIDILLSEYRKAVERKERAF